MAKKHGLKALFKKINEKIFFGNNQERGFSPKRLKEDIESGRLERKLFLGISGSEADFLIKDPRKAPGVLFFGDMGSGKSKGMYATCAVYVAAGNGNTIAVLIDSAKGMNDYKELFKYKERVAVAVDDGSKEDMVKIFTAIDWVYSEMLARQKSFNEVQAPDFKEWENLVNLPKDKIIKYLINPTGPNMTEERAEEWVLENKTSDNVKVAMIVLFFEEFGELLKDPSFDYYENRSNAGTAAYKLQSFQNVGRSYGISLSVATQKLSPDYWPKSLDGGINTKIGFRSENGHYVDMPETAKISDKIGGRCAYLDGETKKTSFVQYPFFGEGGEGGAELVEHYYKPLSAKLFKDGSLDMLHKSLEGKGADGLVFSQKLEVIAGNLSGFKMETIAKRFLGLFNYQIEDVHNDTYPFKTIATRDGIKYALVTIDATSGGRRMGRSEDPFGAEKAKLLIHCMEIEKCQGAIVFSQEPSQSLSSKLGENGIIVDKEKMQVIAKVFDNEDKNKEEGIFKELLDDIQLHHGIEKPPVVEEEVEEDEPPSFISRRMGTSSQIKVNRKGNL
jgi:hypothetical protein